MQSESQINTTEHLLAERNIVKEIEYPSTLNPELVDKWGDGIPVYSEADPNSPEWKETPVVSLDLTSEGFGEVHIKNEADRTSNPTGTIKDRAAWELATLYRDYARALYLKMRAGVLSREALAQTPVPRLSVLTAGNEGTAVAECFKQYDLPPPKLIVSQGLKDQIMKSLTSLRADIYTVNLSRELTGEDIKILSNNKGGVDITSARAIEPSSVFYDWHVHESFSQNPNRIYVPYGSGRLMENYLVWQARTARNDIPGQRDPRLKTSTQKVISIDILGAEPTELNSQADKLTAPFKPFLLFRDEDINTLVNLSFTGKHTGIEKVSEAEIELARQFFDQHRIDAEPSAAAGFGLYLKHYKAGLIDKSEKILIVNTGKGLI